MKLNKTTTLIAIFLILKPTQYCRTLIVVVYMDADLFLAFMKWTVYLKNIFLIWSWLLLFLCI